MITQSLVYCQVYDEEGMSLIQLQLGFRDDLEPLPIDDNE